MIIVTGTVAFDYILDFNGKFADYILPDKIHKINISFMTDGVKKEFGGTAGNQAYTLALLGKRPILATIVGNDFGSFRAPGEYRGYLAEAGVVTDYVEQVDQACAVGFAMTDLDDNQIWGFGNGAAGEIVYYGLNHFLGKLQKTKFFLSSELGFKERLFTLVAPMHDEAMIRWAKECRDAGVRYMFDPAFQIARMERDDLREAIVGAEIVVGNDYEISLIKTKLEIQNPQQIQNAKLATRNNRLWITTLGPEGSMVYDLKNDKELRIKAVDVKKVVDPTGAGDAYRAGFVAGYLRGFSLRTCARMGSVAASFAIEKYGTINHRFTIEEFQTRYKKTYNEKIQLQKKD